MKNDYIEQTDLLEECYFLFHESGYARSKAAFCRKYLKRSGSYMTKINGYRLPSVAVWAKLFMALMDMKKDLMSIEHRFYASDLLKRLKKVIENL